MSPDELDRIAGALLDMPEADRATFLDAYDDDIKAELSSLLENVDDDDFEDDFESDVEHTLDTAEKSADNAESEADKIIDKGESEGNEVDSVESVDEDGDGDADVTVTESRDDNDDMPHDSDTAEKGISKDILDTLSGFRF